MSQEPALRRVLSLPWLVFYGVGVTVGAGIFALIAEIVAIAGDHALYAFAVSGLVAGMTAFSYATLAAAYPHAAGAAFFVGRGLGHWPGLLVGYGIAATAIASSAVIAVAFAGYVENFSGLPAPLTLIAAFVLMTAVAVAGVKESVGAAAFITLLEVGTLLAVGAAGLPLLFAGDVAARVFVPPLGLEGWSPVMAAGFLAFFAFIGFEDIVNLSEETVDAERTIPRAIVLTLIVSLALYGLLAAVAAAYPDRQALVASKAPLAVLFEGVSGLPGTVIAMMASVAMINGILVQMVMAGRLLFGMANEGMAPRIFARVLPRRRTPAVGILAVAVVAMALGLALPLLRLAELTSLIILVVFAAVNASLFLIGRRRNAAPVLRRRRYWGAAGAALSLGLIASEFMG